MSDGLFHVLTKRNRYTLILIYAAVFAGLCLSHDLKNLFMLQVYLLFFMAVTTIMCVWALSDFNELVTYVQQRT